MTIGLQDVFTGTVANDGTGTKGRLCFQAFNNNNALIEAAMEDAERKAFVVSIGDPDTVVEAKNNAEAWRQPYAFVLLEVRASVDTPQSGDDIEIDITEDGVSIFQSGDALIIPAGSEGSLDYSPQPDVAYTILEDWGKISIDVVSVGSGATAKGLKVYLIGYVIWT